MLDSIKLALNSSKQTLNSIYKTPFSLKEATQSLTSKIKHFGNELSSTQLGTKISKVSNPALKFYLQNSNSISFIIFLSGITLLTFRSFAAVHDFSLERASATSKGDTSTELKHKFSYLQYNNLPNLKDVLNRKFLAYSLTNLTGIALAGCAVFYKQSIQAQSFFIAGALTYYLSPKLHNSYKRYQINKFYKPYISPNFDAEFIPFAEELANNSYEFLHKTLKSASSVDRKVEIHNNLYLMAINTTVMLL